MDPCRGGGIGRRTGLKILRPQKPYRFDSGPRHHETPKVFQRYKSVPDLRNVLCTRNAPSVHDMCFARERIYIISHLRSKYIAWRKPHFTRRSRISLMINRSDSYSAGWSSLAARRAHNPEVAGSNPAPATIHSQGENVNALRILPLAAHISWRRSSGG
jgi:hypothetical protein